MPLARTADQESKPMKDRVAELEQTVELMQQQQAMQQRMLANIIFEVLSESDFRDLKAIKTISAALLDLNVRDADNNTILHALLNWYLITGAMRYELTELTSLIKHFIDRGADWELVNKAGKKPIDIAAETPDFEEIMFYMLDKQESVTSAYYESLLSKVELGESAWNRLVHRLAKDQAWNGYALMSGDKCLWNDPNHSGVDLPVVLVKFLIIICDARRTLETATDETEESYSYSGLLVRDILIELRAHVTKFDELFAQMLQIMNPYLAGFRFRFDEGKTEKTRVSLPLSKAVKNGVYLFLVMQKDLCAKVVPGIGSEIRFVPGSSTSFTLDMAPCVIEQAKSTLNLDFVLALLKLIEQKHMNRDDEYSVEITSEEQLMIETAVIHFMREDQDVEPIIKFLKANIGLLGEQVFSWMPGVVATTIGGFEATMLSAITEYQKALALVAKTGAARPALTFSPVATSSGTLTLTGPAVSSLTPTGNAVPLDLNFG